MDIHPKPTHPSICRDCGEARAYAGSGQCLDCFDARYLPKDDPDLDGCCAWDRGEAGFSAACSACKAGYG